MIAAKPLVVDQEDQKAFKRALEYLKKWQEEVDSTGKHEKWDETKGTITLKQVREWLNTLLPGLSCCAYCGRGAADTVEHFYPKSKYPFYTFVLDNLFMVCGKCNSSKGSKYDKVEQQAHKSQQNTVLPKYRKLPLPTQPTPKYFINPRWEDPAPYFALDFEDFFIVNQLDEGHGAFTRVKQVLDVLPLDEFRKSREASFVEFCNFLSGVIEDYNNHRLQIAERQRYIQELCTHPFVWHEMKRHYTQYDQLNEWQQMLRNVQKLKQHFDELKALDPILLNKVLSW